VCWRLARQLAGEHGLAVTLWIDDVASLARIAPSLDPDQDDQPHRGVRIRRWTQPLPADATPADVVIDGLGGGLPESYAAAMAEAPHPPVWIGGWGDITLRRAATLADNWVPGPTADLARLLAGKQQFLANRRAAGRNEAVTEWPLTRDVIIADTDREARELAEKHIMISYRKEYAGGWRHPFIDASIATDLDALMQNRFLIGGPDQVVRALRPFVTEYGMTHLICRVFFPGMPHRHIMRELELIAKEVRPAFA